MKFPCLLISKHSIDLGGFFANPTKIAVVVVGDADVDGYYNTLKATVAALSGNKIKLDIEIRHVPDTIFTLQKFNESWLWYNAVYHVSLENEKSFFTGTSPDRVIRQLVYDITGYTEKPIYSCAFQGREGNVQYSQVILPDSSLHIVALHEAIGHGWCSYFGIEDKTHEFLKDSNLGFPALIDYLLPYIKQDLPLLFYIPMPKK